MVVYTCDNVIPSQMVSPVVWMKAVVFRRFSMLPHSCSCSFAPWGHDEYSSSALERGSASNGQSSGLDDGCGLWKLVLHVTQWLVLAALLHGATAVFLLL